MGLSYWINCAWTGSIEQLAAALVVECGFATDTAKYGPTHDATMYLKSEWSHISLTRSSIAWRKMLQQELGVIVYIDIICRIDDDFSTSGNEGRILTKAVGVLLQRTTGDLVFLFDGEKVLLLRDLSGVAIDPQSGWWNQRNRATISAYAAFVEKPLPTI